MSDHDITRRQLVRSTAALLGLGAGDCYLLVLAAGSDYVVMGFAG